MHLAAIDPTHTADARIKIDKQSLDRIGHVNSNEETFCLHFPRRISAPGCASSPLRLIAEGNPRLTIFIT